MIHFVRVLPWGLSVNRAAYYGYWFCLHIGPWFIFIAKDHDA
jgi:hypothetical protein